MSVLTALVAELQHESANTRKMFQRLSQDQFSYQPHEKSMSLIELASHIAEIPGLFAARVMTTPELDFAQEAYTQPLITSPEALLAFFEENLSQAVSALQQGSEADLEQVWTLRNGEKVFVAAPRKVIIRNVCLNHLIHHRGQLSVYLRLAGVPVPGMYGPSADEMF